MAEIIDLARTAALLAWDQQVMMPPRGGPGRAEQLAVLRRITHEKFTSPEIGRLLEQLEGFEAEHEYDSFEASFVRRTRTDWEKARKIPTELRVEMARAQALALPVWVEARKNNDFASYLPALRENFELRRRYVACFDGEYAEPYDALLDDFEEGMTTARGPRPLRLPEAASGAARQEPRGAGAGAVDERPGFPARGAEGIRARGRAQLRVRRERLAPRPDRPPVRAGARQRGHPCHDALLRRPPRRAVRDDARDRPRPLRAPGRPRVRPHAARRRRLARLPRVAEPDVGEPRRAVASVLAPLLPAAAGRPSRRRSRGYDVERWYREVNAVRALADPRRGRRGDLQPAHHPSLRARAADARRRRSRSSGSRRNGTSGSGTTSGSRCRATRSACCRTRTGRPARSATSRRTRSAT